MSPFNNMPPFIIALIIICAVMLVGIIVLYFLGRKSQKRKEEQDAQIAATAQTISMLVIDKKKMRLMDAGLPAIVVEKTPKLLRRSKVPVVKVKAGPKVMTMLCDAEVFDLIPVKKEVKAVVSGLYITGVKGIRGPIEAPPKKKGIRAKLQAKLNEARKTAGSGKDGKDGNNVKNGKNGKNSKNSKNSKNEKEGKAKKN